MRSSASGVRPAAAGKRRPKAAQRVAGRIVIQYPSPSVDEGRYPAKRSIGDTVRVEADIFRDGHDLLRAVVRHRPPGGRWRESEMQPIDAHLDGVRWAGSFVLERTGRYEYTVEAWTDVFGTWRDELRRKLEAGDRKSVV